MKLLTKKYGNTSIRWQYNMTNGDRDVTKAYLEQQSGDNWEVVKEISVVRKPTEKKKIRVVASRNFLHNPHMNKHKILKTKNEIYVLQ